MTTAAKKATASLRKQFALAFAIGAVAFALVAGVRLAGGLERIELVIHDRVLNARAGLPAQSRSVVIYETEADLQRFGHPLTDERMAEFLSRLAAMQPALVAVDKYRDLPIPPGTEQLDRTLTDNTNIFWVAKYGTAAFDGVRPPKILEGTARAACADIIVDADLRVRRALVAIGEGERACPSLAYVLAATWLASHGTPSGFDAARDYSLLLGDTMIPRLRPWDGPYAAADTSGYQIPLGFRRALPARYTLSQVMDGTVPAEAIRGKVVFFGSSATSLRDFFDVPARNALDDASIPGVLVHSLIFDEMVDAAMEKDVFRMASLPFTLAESAVMGLFCAFVLLAAVRVPIGGAIALLSVAAWLPVSLLLAQAHMIVAPLTPALTGLLAAMLAAGFRAWREAQDRQELMGWFSKHVSREVAEAIWEEREQFTAGGIIPPQNVRVTVLFADIRNYTTISEKMEIPQMVAWLNRAISCMCDAVMDNNGIVTRFAGDQVMAVFGVPIPRTTDEAVRDDAANAIAAGLAMGERLAELNKVFSTEGQPSARVRVGLYSGEVVQAGLGSRERFEFTVLGDVVNTASRLESYTSEDDGEPARVLIGAPTFELAGDRFETEPLGEILLKGKNAAVSVYRVRRRDANKTDAATASITTPAT